MGWVIAGLRVLQNVIETAPITERIAEIAGIGDAFPTSEAIRALCERLRLSGQQSINGWPPGAGPRTVRN